MSVKPSYLHSVAIQSFPDLDLESKSCGLERCIC